MKQGEPNRFWSGKVSGKWIAYHLGVSAFHVQKWRKNRKGKFPDKDSEKALELARKELVTAVDKATNRQPIGGTETLEITVPSYLSARLKYEAGDEFDMGEIIELHLRDIPFMFEDENNGDELL